MGKTEDDTQNYSKQWKDDPQNYINNKERKDDESSPKPNKPQIEKVLLPFFFFCGYSFQFIWSSTEIKHQPKSKRVNIYLQIITTQVTAMFDPNITFHWGSTYRLKKEQAQWHAIDYLIME